MILGPDSEALQTPRHDLSRWYRDAGYLSDTFVNYLALLVVAHDDETTIVPRDVLAREFCFDRLEEPLVC